MKKNQQVFKVGLFLSALIFIFGNSNNPPNGKTGAPAEGTCMDCHGGSNAGFAGEIEIIGLPDKLLPTTIYNLTARVRVTNGTPQKAGFQLVALDANNLNSGNLAAQGGTSFIENSGGRTYVEHRPAQLVNNDFVDYNFEWFSPETAGKDSVVFYAASVLADGNGSTSNDQVIFLKKQVFLSNNSAIFVGVTSINPTCFGGNNGSATAGAGAGFGNFSYLWSNGDSIETATNLSAGMYEVTVTDDQGHSAITSVEIGQPDDIQANATVSDLSTIGGSDGSIILAPTGGASGYTYLWPQTGDTTSTLSNLSFGPRWVDITDAAGCIRGDTFFINNPLCDMMVDIQTKDVTCFGGSDGEAIVNVTGGTAPFNYNFAGNVPSNLGAGTYSVTVLDAKNCGIIDTFIINQPTALDVEPTINQTCTGREISLNVSGGVPPYSYLWKDGSIDSFNFVLDTVDIDITDANNCLFEIFLSLAAVDEVTVMLDSVSSTESTIYVTPDGGTSPYMYTWEDENGNVISTEEDITGVLTDGIYTLTIEDSNGCITSLQVVVMGISSTANIQSFAMVGKVFPNPADELLTIEINTKSSSSVGVTLFNSSNRMVLNSTPSILDNSQKEISVSHLAKGLYFLKIQIEDSVYFQKVIIE